MHGGCAMSAVRVGSVVLLLSMTWPAHAQQRASVLEPFVAPCPPFSILQPFVYHAPKQPAAWTAPKADGPLPIDLPSALRLVNARSLDVAIAAQRIEQA